MRFSDSIIIRASRLDLYSVITEFELLPQICEDFIEVVVEKVVNDTYYVSFRSMFLKKEFEYSLQMVQNRPSELRFRLIRGQKLASYDGRWKLDVLDDATTILVLEVDFELKMSLPAPIVRRMVSMAMKRMLSSYKEWAERNVE